MNKLTTIKRLSLALLVALLVGCSAGKPERSQDTSLPVPSEPSAATNEPPTPAPSPQPQPPAERTKLPELISVNYGEEGKEQDVYLLPIPVTLKAVVRGAKEVQWRVVGLNDYEFLWLVPEEVRPGEWTVEWGNPNPPGPRPAYLVLRAEVGPEVPDSPTIVREFTKRWVILAKVKVKSAW